MTTSVPNVPYLMTSRKFPQDPGALQSELTKMYVDTAACVNARTIGIFELMASITGERWFTEGGDSQVKRQSQRQVYQFDDSSLTFNHGISGATLFTRIYGTFTNGTNWYPLPYVDPTAANQVGIRVSSTQVVITKGGGAPAITDGIVVLEWLSQ
jgi:hypothetical protein